MAIFDERLRAAMTEKGITQSVICKSTGIPKSAMSQYFSGKFIPRQNRVNQLASILDVDPAWLLGIESKNELSHREHEIIEAYRNDVAFKNSIDMMLDGRTVFRAAKTEDGRTSPKNEKLSAQKLDKIASAPETDQDF